ncbi:unnamed protein product [Macrosiphum euphorbiae]|uniref:Uncharacterized protein n=1 Tax=Macrosiphum euphorbiae TaxID=13131 RepID=A0AAV0WV67_9HEMI|nr:unnamed protein product [Macrosiphum euphorbiae]
MASLEEMTNIGLKIMRSKLAPWQRIDALKTFFFPSTVHLMRMGTFQKTAWENIDNIIRPEIKATLYLPQEASSEYLYGSTNGGCCGIRMLAEDSDIAAVDSAFKLLTSPDGRVATDARSHIHTTTEKRIGRPPSTEEVALYLSGEDEGPFRAKRGTGVKSVWSCARMASKRNKVNWNFTNNSTIIKHMGVELKPKNVMRCNAHNAKQLQIKKECGPHTKSGPRQGNGVRRSPPRRDTLYKKRRLH